MGNISLRKLRVLIQHLPLDSSLARAYHGHGWTEEMWLLAAIFDILNFSRADFIHAHGGKYDPEPMPKPGDKNAPTKAERQGELNLLHDNLMARLRGGDGDTAFGG